MNADSVRWLVNGIIGGNLDVGTISSSGVFVAPPTSRTETISCESTQYASVKASLDVKILNPIASLSSASVLSVSKGTATIDLRGSGFVAQSSVAIDGDIAPATYVSENELRTVASISTDPKMIAIAVSNPDPGASDSAQIKVLLPPSDFRALIGCDNPNTSKTFGEWGPEVDAEYIPLSNQTQLIGSPKYSSNAIFWMSRENTPGASILMAGAFTPAAKTAKVALIPPGTTDWKSIVKASSQSVTTTQQGTTGLSFIVPSGFDKGVYGFEIDDPVAAPLYALANQPEIDWLMGVPTSPSAASALQAEVHPCGAEPGETLRIFGKNFMPTDQVILQPASGPSTRIIPSQVLPTSITAQVPPTMAPGAYYLWVGSADRDATSSAMTILSIVAPPSPAIAKITCSSIVADGHTDNSRALQACLDENAPEPSGGHIQHVSLPPGTIVLGSGVVLHPFQVLLGTSKESTTLEGKAPIKSPWVTLPQHSAIANLSLIIPDGSPAFASLHCDFGYPEVTGHIFIMSVDLQSTSGTTSSPSSVFGLCGPDIQIYESSFTAATWNDNFAIGYGDGTVVSGNRFDISNAYFATGGGQNAIMERNEFYSPSFPNSTGNTAIAVGGRAFLNGGPSMVSRNIYIGSNSFHNMGSHATDGQGAVITSDGGGGSYYGTVVSSTAETVTLANDPNWRWQGITYPGAAFVVIIKGTGAGQYSPVSSWNGRTVTIEEPWTVPPDSTSWVEIISLQRNVAIVQNTFTDTINFGVCFGDAAELVIEDNVLTNSGRGILTQSYGPYGGPAAFGPLLNTDVLRNKIAVGEGDYIVPSPNTNVAGIGVFNGYGTISSGEMVRGNEVPEIQSIYLTNGYNGLNATIIENNKVASCAPSPITQFWVRCESAP